MGCECCCVVIRTALPHQLVLTRVGLAHVSGCTLVHATCVRLIYLEERSTDVISKCVVEIVHISVFLPLVCRVAIVYLENLSTEVISRFVVEIVHVQICKCG